VAIGESGNRNDVLIQQQYISDLMANCEYAINLSATDDPTYGAAALLGTVQAANPGNPWGAFKVYLDTMANLHANLTNEKWLGVPVAADVFQFENAGTAIESLRIDYGVLGLLLLFEGWLLS
jgi:hypothetical protein